MALTASFEEIVTNFADYQPPAPEPGAEFERTMTAADMVLFVSAADSIIPDDAGAIINATARPEISQQVFLAEPEIELDGPETPVRPNATLRFSNHAESRTHYANSLLDLQPEAVGGMVDVALSTLEAKYPFLDPPKTEAEQLEALRKVLPEKTPKPEASVHIPRQKEKVPMGTEADFTRVMALIDRLYNRSFRERLGESWREMQMFTAIGSMATGLVTSGTGVYMHFASKAGVTLHSFVESWQALF